MGLSTTLGTGTHATGIDGDNVVGYYFDSSNHAHGFLYNVLTSLYTDLDDPLGTNGTLAEGISGNNIVGFYQDSSGNNHGFEATLSSVPEPSTLALFFAGAVGLLAFAWRRARA